MFSSSSNKYDFFNAGLIFSGSLYSVLKSMGDWEMAGKWEMGKYCEMAVKKNTEAATGGVL